MSYIVVAVVVTVVDVDYIVSDDRSESSQRLVFDRWEKKEIHAFIFITRVHLDLKYIFSLFVALF